MAWTCNACRVEHADDALLWCEPCGSGRYASFAVMVAEHILEHIADGLNEPLDVLKAMQTRPVGAYASLTLAFIAQQMRLLTKDTTALARALLKARAARTALEVLETGDAKDKLAVLKGIQVLGEVVEHKGELVTKHVVELHEGPPPERKA